ncbi:hypothetical protein [Photobacterium sp. GB-27]|nr:hypothetical protein [Photobacterium sp. GB-27]
MNNITYILDLSDDDPTIIDRQAQQQTFEENKTNIHYTELS